MKKKLSQAIAMATLVGAAGAANAMYVDGNGVGEVLLYPLYSADAGNDTYVSVTNTTGEFKAVKVRVLEHKNSQEVLDFNLYLSPEDKWSAAITLDGNGNPVLKTFDTSCTVGKVTSAGIPFVNYLYKDDSDSSLDRAKLGHIELIEMGTLDPDAVLSAGVTVKQAIEHVDGVPGNCAAVTNAFRAGGLWAAGNTGLGFIDADEEKGGLYGTGSIVNVDAGWQASYDAVALADTYEAKRHFPAGDVQPNFGSLNPIINTFDGEEYEMNDSNGVEAGFNAVSALLSKAAIFNDYVYGAGLDAQTDMVVTFPTKNVYVNNGVVSPFTKAWNPVTSTACEDLEVAYWDAEEGTRRPETNDFSPPPPEAEGFQLCYETNILHIGENSNLFGGDDGHKALKLDNGFEAGWVRLDFETGSHVLGSEEGGATFEGLPVIGFSTIAITNGDILDGVLSNYASTYQHKATPAVVETP